MPLTRQKHWATRAYHQFLVSRRHAPFAWGRDSMDAAYHAVVLEAIARMGFYTATLNPECRGVSQALLDRHYFRKHGARATYGQESGRR